MKSNKGDEAMWQFSRKGDLLKRSLNQYQYQYLTPASVSRPNLFNKWVFFRGSTHVASHGTYGPNRFDTRPNVNEFDTRPFVPRTQRSYMRSELLFNCFPEEDNTEETIYTCCARFIESTFAVLLHLHYV